MIITISGLPGSGKSTVAKMLAKKLNYNFFSTGDLHGMIAKEKGITINQLMEEGKKNLNIHYEMDKRTKEIGEKKDNFVIESWLAYHFIPHSYKIFLKVDERTGIKRIMGDKREDEPTPKDINLALIQLKKRVRDSEEGFKKAYGINFLDEKNYDLIINTTNLAPEEVLKIAEQKIFEKTKNDS